jgi:hypothetical protein
MATCGHRYESTIDDILVAPLPPAKWNELRLHLRDCGECRERYNRVSLAERMLHGGPAAIGTVSPQTITRIGDAVLDGARPRGLAAVPRWAFSLFAVGVTAALLPFVLRAQLIPTGKAPIPEFAVRGSAAGDPSSQAGLRAFCLVGPTSEIHPLESAGAACGQGDLLKLTYSNKAGYQDLFLVGVDGDYAVKWYEPRPPSAISVPAQRGVDLPVGGAIRVGVNHDPGPVRIYALFAHAPIAAREIEAAVAELKRTRKSLADAASLPLSYRDDVTQRSLLVEITKGH